MFELDKQQEKVVYAEQDKIIVASGAGAGKTACLTSRINFLLSQGYEPANIYAITYTNFAAEEMKSRLPVKTAVFVGTIHSLANRILRQNKIDTSWILESENFDELFNIFEENPDIRLPQIDYLLVDEFQDICDSEYEFIFGILNPKQFMVFGDSAQSIYSFKGGNFQHFMSMVNSSDIKVYNLNNNYRCGKNIIDFAERFIYPINDIYMVPNESKVSTLGTVVNLEFSLDMLLEEINDFYYNYKDIFILTRTNREIKTVQNLLDKNNIPNDTFKKADLDKGEITSILQKDSVKILTVHSAKGLEAKKVIAIGLNCFNNEERRICYVAATRAKEELVWFTNKPQRRSKKTKMISWG